MSFFHSFKDMCISFLHGVDRLIKNYEIWMNDILTSNDFKIYYSLLLVYNLTMFKDIKIRNLKFNTYNNHGKDKRIFSI